MDVFIPVGDAYTPENQNFTLPDYGELRYTLRSIEKHLEGMGDVLLIFGSEKLPTWLDTLQVRIAFHADMQKPEYKQRNIHQKTLRALTYDWGFLFMNDDHFLLRDFDVNEFPDFCAPASIGEIHQGMRGRTAYKDTVENTTELLGPDARFYDLHCPMRMTREEYVSAFEGVNMLKPGGYCLKSVFGNRSNASKIRIEDCKIHGVESADRIRQRIAGRPFFSAGANAFGPGLLAVLDELYPNKSVFEK